MDIHNQTGTIERPLGTLADQLPEAAKKDLEHTVKQVVSQASYARRARWWFEDHPIQSGVGAMLLGAAAAVAAIMLINRNRD